MISFPSSMSGNSVVIVIALGPAFNVEPAMGDVATKVLAWADGANNKVISAAVRNIALPLLFTLCLLAR
jgi:hypothetical protein